MAKGPGDTPVDLERDKHLEESALADLKLKKSRAQAVFTRSRNRLHELLSDEDSDKDDLRANLDKLETAMDNLSDIITLIVTNHKENGRTSEMKKALSEIDTMNAKYEETAKLYQCFGTESDTSSVAEEPEDKTVSSDMYKQLKRVSIPIFKGEKKQYEFWKSAFKSCIDETNATAEYKFLQLRQYLGGEALKTIEGLGHSAAAYDAAKDRLERKFGGQRRKVNRFLEEIDAFPLIKYENTTMINKFADLLDIALINLKENESSDLKSGFLCLQLLKKLPQSMIARYERWKFEHEREESVETLREWTMKEAEFFNVAMETKLGLDTNQRSDRKPDRERYERSYRDKVNDSHRSERNYHATKKNEQDGKFSSRCTLCSANHGIWKCESFKALPVTERWNKAKELKLCFRCLSENHMGTACPKKWKCRVNSCKKNHHTLLHTSDERQMAPQASFNTTTVSNSHDDNSFSAYQPKPRVALRTVPVMLQNGKRKFSVNALLDDGSTKSYINADIAAELGLDSNNDIQRIEVNVLSGKSESFESKPVTVGIESLNGQIRKNIEVQTIKNVTGNLPAVDWNRYAKQYPHLREIQFPQVARDQKVDLLIGIDYPELHMSLHEISGRQGEPVARLTPLGWTCVGPTATETNISMYTFFQRDSCEIKEFNKTLKEFWEIEHETVSSNRPEISVEEQQVLRKTEKTVTCKESRYEIGIPWKDSEPKLPENYEMALKRLENTEKRLNRNPELAKSYHETIQKYMDKGYVEKVSDNCGEIPGQWFLPHFPVIKPDKDTTKVRIVFDASAKTEGVSLNDAIYEGPKLQRDLFDVLLRFRKYPVAVVCDIAEMYLQIGLKKSDRPYHRFLWRSEPEKPPDTYQFNRLVFGVNCSPFLAQLVSQKHASVLVNEYPMAAETVLKSTYMDDSMDSVPNEQHGVELYRQLSELWQRAGMHARKWLSNSQKVLKDIPQEDRAKEVDLETTNMPAIKTLGVWWSSADDKFNIRVNENQETGVLTKRTVLSKIATVFDPIGMVAPVVVRGKMLLQEMWTSGLDWDERLDPELEEKVQMWLSDLSELRTVTLERSLEFQNELHSEMHVFSDASTEAYGAVVYVRHVYPNGEIVIKFVAAKTRVAPLKSVSIPRLELIAAVLGLRLCEQITKTLKIPISDVTFWSDSMNVLWWVRAKSRSFKPFVANRIGTIQTITEPQQWRYVPTKENPADLTTRGRTATDLGENTLWWSGPAFLGAPEGEWPENKFQQNDNAKCEMKIKSSTENAVNFSFKSSSDNENRLDPENYSSWNQLVRVSAWVNRFIENCQLTKDERNCNKELLLGELRNVENLLIRRAQAEDFEQEYQNLQKGKPIPNTSKILSLNPKLDEEGVMRSDSRLKFAEHLPYDSKYPVILPRKNSVTKLIVKHHHESGNHCGTNQTLAKLSARYWVVSGREEIRDVENECQECKRRKQKTAHQKMGPLPGYRLGRSIRAFSQTAVDYAGPFLTKQGRGKPRHKRYLCLFTCMGCRAVHLELSYSMDTDSFLNAFYRFVNRRGLPEMVLSDNGTNFVGAVRELKELYNELDKDQIAKKGANQGIQWRFIPPGTPHFGGVHESMIKSAKRAVYAILQNADITDEELLTAFTGAESLMNSRPLTFQSANPKDECVLTPNHFLHGQLGGEFAPETVDSTQFSYRKRWRRVQELVKHFWGRWLREFLPTLATRKKWHPQRRNFVVGDVVLAVDPDTTRGKWPLGRVTRVYPGADGQVRVAEVQIANKIVKRPIHRLCLIVPSESAVQEP